MKASGYILGSIVNKLEEISKVEDLSKLEEVVQEFEKLVSKYSDDIDLKNYYVKLEKIYKKKEINELESLITELKNEAHWRQIKGASGSTLPYGDYRRLKKL